jgi:hypothetical protein
MGQRRMEQRIHQSCSMADLASIRERVLHICERRFRKAKHPED